MNDDVIFRFSPIEICTPVATRAPYWAPLDAMLRILIALFATPALLCRTGCKSRMIAHALLLQLREAEALARTLLLRDAQAIAATLPAPSKRTRKRQAETREPPLFTADYRAWRVAFRFAAPKPSRHEGKRPRHANVAEHAFLRMLAPYDPSAPPPDDFDPPPRRFNARATAARYEALRRVIENPAPFAKRLAQRLRARERRKGVTSAAPTPRQPEECPGQARALGPDDTS